MPAPNRKDIKMISTKKTSLLLGLAALAALLPSPARAGEALVPIASAQTINDTFYQTRLWVTNQGTVPRRLSVKFVAVDANGVQAPVTGGATVNPGATVLLQNVAPIGRPGMLLLSGAPQLTVAARLEAASGNGAIAAANLPVITGTSVAVANAVLVLQGLGRSADGMVSDVHIINASEETASCVLAGFKSEGQRIAEAVNLAVKPLSLRSFEDALGSLGQTALSAARFTVTCNKPFYAFARVQRPGTPQLQYVGPSASIGQDTSATASDEGDLPEGDGYPQAEATALEGALSEQVAGDVNADGSVTLDVPGEFLRARNGASYKGYPLPIRPGQLYRRAVIEYDLFEGKFRTPLFHGIMGLHRPDPDRRKRVLFLGFLIRGSNGFKTILDIGKDPRTGAGELIKSNTGPWRANTNFHVRFDYDVTARRVTLQVWKAGQLVQTLSGQVNNLDLMAPPGRSLYLDFGMTGVADGAYFPPMGWVYSNLKVKLTP